MASNAAEQSTKQWEADVGDSKQGDGQNARAYVLFTVLLLYEHLMFLCLKFDLHQTNPLLCLI